MWNSHHLCCLTARQMPEQNVNHHQDKQRQNINISAYRVLDPTVGLKHLVDGVPSDAGVVAVLLLVVVVGIARTEGLHLGALPLLLHVGDQLLPRHLNRLHRLSSHRVFATEYRSFCKNV